jgi:hypothetical protein
LYLLVCVTVLVLARVFNCTRVLYATVLVYYMNYTRVLYIDVIWCICMLI